jgi:hypothetical protein
MLSYLKKFKQLAENIKALKGIKYGEMLITNKIF